ncbi:hypothetical protein GCM10009792_26170 [Microcella alkalica]|uniref:ABC-type enterochelin transport system permease subunit n=1 Tax=Microcella alkalica TaxID=355930 RepID=A0A839ED30_9MICO|nr:ABC-type enterochelin transport system permease subunit [Microcella alkalica]
MGMFWTGIGLLVVALLIVVVGVNIGMQAAGPVYFLGLLCAGFGTLWVIRGLLYHRR